MTSSDLEHLELIVLRTRDRAKEHLGWSAREKKIIFEAFTVLANQLHEFELEHRDEAENISGKHR